MKNSKGFTLIELMIIVVIVGLLATFAIPSYRNYLAKSQQTEARTNLAAVYVGMLAYTAPALQDGFLGATLENIGFETYGSDRYSYSLSNVSTNDFLAKAEGRAGEVSGDVWQIDVTKVIEDVDNQSFNR